PSSSASYALKPSTIKDDELVDIKTSVDRDVERGVAGGVVGKPTETSADAPRDNLAKNKKQEVINMLNSGSPNTERAKDASEPVVERIQQGIRLDSPAIAGTKTNNLNSVLTGSIHTTYGTLVNSLYDFKGANSGITTARKVFIDSKTQLQNLLGSSTSVDINKIDFNNQVALAVFLGQVTNNTTVTISKVSLVGNDLIVTLSQQTGASSSSTTTPFHIVVIPRQIGATKLDAKNIFVRFE
ncbi:MAG: hypothetical protein FD167_1150, partial [bacterium]